VAAGKGCINSGLKGRDNERVEFIAIGQMLTNNLSCASTKLIGGDVVFEVAPEQVNYQQPIDAMSTAQMTHQNDNEGDYE